MSLFRRDIILSAMKSQFEERNDSSEDLLPVLLSADKSKPIRGSKLNNLFRNVALREKQHLVEQLSRQKAMADQSKNAAN